MQVQISAGRGGSREALFLYDCCACRFSRADHLSVLSLLPSVSSLSAQASLVPQRAVT